ncbi:lipopolysaccharide assembly protein LapB [Rhodoferax sp. PAMC 29310]|uniref:tetratricopeptide repeat protein n=1 Tax=Rhodoferax sp. PAMC 29310 TaxID=2822760 RepID=UPI001F0B1858|nr:tetratricopeptide repeat protein [Rhodoferax sp. PAMC 29310]
MHYYDPMLRFNRLAILVTLTCALGVNAQNLAAENQAPHPHSSQLTGPLFYQLLMGELNARAGDAGAAYSLVLDAARKTESAQLFQRAVEIALQARSGPSALQAAQAWKQVLPDSKEANGFLFQILIGLNRIGDTLEPLKQELVSTPAVNRPKFIAAIPQYYVRTSDKKLAADTVEKALSKHLSDPTEASASWTTIARMRFDAGNLDGAIDATRKAQNADPAAKGPVLLSLYLMREQVPHAEALVLLHLERNSTPEIRMDYARTLLGAQRFAEAQAQLQIMTTAHPDFQDSWLIQGVLQAQEGNLEAAERSLQQYISLVQRRQNNQSESDKGLTQAYLSLSQIAEQRKQYEIADAWLNRIDSKDSVLSAQLRRAVLMAKQGQVNAALQLIHNQSEDSDSDARMKIATEVQILREEKQFAAAYSVLKSAIEQNPNDWDFVYDMAMVVEKMGNLAEMERLLRSIIASKPDYHHAYNALGYSLADRGHLLPEAKQLILKALEYAKADPFIMDSLGWVEFRSGNHEEAIRILQSAFNSKPDAEIAAHLGEVMWTMGKRQEAIEIWKQGNQINPKNDTLTDTLKRLGVKW